jgi:cysteine-rich repeat protein
VVGAPRHDIPASGSDPALTDAGAAYLLDSSSGALLQSFLSPEPGTGDLFGSAVATLGTNVLVGAPVGKAGGFNTGTVYLFDPSGGLLRTFVKPAPVLNDLFGESIAAVGNDKVLIGARGDDAGAMEAGAAYLYHAATGTLLQTVQKVFPASNDEFGRVVAVVGSSLLVGAPLDDTRGVDAGAAYLFEETSCGNGLVEPGEQCEDGNILDGDGCDSNCTLTGCGNGVVTAGEQCDDGNLIAGDGCSSSCQNEGVCGNGVLEVLEWCDDGNLADGDGCDSNCTMTGCGNGIVTAGEQCDTGAANGFDLCCAADCQVADTDGDGLCDSSDVCPTIPDPAQTNTDGDAFGDACDICPADSDNDSDGDRFCFGAEFNPPAIGGGDLCSRGAEAGAWLKPQVIFGKLDLPLGDEKMKIKGSFVIGNALPAVDPVRYGIRVRVTDKDGTIIVDELIPGGEYVRKTSLSGWKAKGRPTPRKWIYVDTNETLLHNGIQKITVKDQSGFTPGRIAFFAKAKNGTYVITPGEEPLAVTVELNPTAFPPGHTPGRDQCGEVRFTLPPLAPSCWFQGSNLNVLKCR